MNETASARNRFEAGQTRKRRDFECEQLQRELREHDQPMRLYVSPSVAKLLGVRPRDYQNDPHYWKQTEQQL